MGQRFLIGLSTLCAGILLLAGAAFAQQVPLSSPRDSLVFTTLDKLQARETAIVDSMQEAQLKVMERKYAKLPPKQSTPLPEAKKAPAGKPVLAELLSRAHSYVSTTATWDNNANDAVNDRKGDIIYDVIPGMRLNFVSLGKSLSFDTHIESTYYLNNPETNKLNLVSTVDQRMILGSYSFSVGDSFSTNYISSKKFAISDAGLDRKNINTFSTSLGRNFNRYGFDFGYSRTDELHDAVHRDNITTLDTWHLLQFLRIASKTRLAFEYGRDHRVFPRNPTGGVITTTDENGNTVTSASGNSDTDTYGLSVTGVLSPKVSYSAGTTYKSLTAKGGGDALDVGVGTSIGYRVSDRTNMALRFDRTRHDAVADIDETVKYVYSISGNHRLAFNPKLNVSLGYAIEDTYYPHTVDFGHELSLSTFKMGLTYAFRKWLDFSLGYMHQVKHANFEGDFPDTQVSFSSQARF